jgi:LmbE family N-acetylglucosaminyl deacetylase
MARTLNYLSCSMLITKNSKAAIWSLCLTAGLFQCASPNQTPSENAKGKVILAVFAHPDDEATVSPVLAKYAALGADVYVAVATDGRYGVTQHAGIPAGDSLAAVRYTEMVCAAEKLGIKPPILFGLHDQLKMQQGYEGIHGQLDTLRMHVRQLFVDLKPDVVLTWNASGWTGHHDHRLVSAVVTEVFQHEVWTKPSQLYYAAIPTGNMPAESPMQLATVDLSYLTVKISVSDVDYAKAKESWLCHKSQYTPDIIEQLHALTTGASNGTVYFHALKAETSKTTLF